MLARRSWITILTASLFCGSSVMGDADPTPAPAVRVVPDSQVDSLIDPRFSPQERAIVRQILLRMRPEQRARGFILRDGEGKFHASSCDLLAFEIHEQLLRAGLTVYTPDGPYTQPLVRSVNYPAAASCGISIPATGRINEATPVPSLAPSSAPSPH
jgi:hypothetical protein